ncbi:hypothetical protein GCM10025331_42100 [Actinoplanes utahensis]|nr:hypothetical protein Aut01nite_02030 [Actinoplanes utahensis]
MAAKNAGFAVTTMCSGPVSWAKTAMDWPNNVRTSSDAISPAAAGSAACCRPETAVMSGLPVVVEGAIVAYRQTMGSGYARTGETARSERAPNASSGIRSTGTENVRGCC